MREPLVSPDHIAGVLRRIVAGVPERIEAAMGGISTTVYRIVYPRETYYLRLMPNSHDSFASEVAVHTRLRALGVLVPEVIHYEHHNATLGRSLLITTAIAGTPVSESAELGEAALREIVEAAGRDLAVIHSVAVRGFGRLRGRADSHDLVAPLPTRSATLVGWDEALATLTGSVLSAAEVHTLARVFERASGDHDGGAASLAHGDFSTRHIFQQDGRYTGIIDFGDSRGDDRSYDLGYFHMRDGGLLPYRLEAALLAGYGAHTPLPPDADQRIRVASVLLAVPLLAISVRHQAWDGIAQHLLDGLRRDLVAIARDDA